MGSRHSWSQKTEHRPPRAAGSWHGRPNPLPTPPCRPAVAGKPGSASSGVDSAGKLCPSAARLTGGEGDRCLRDPRHPAFTATQPGREGARTGPPSRGLRNFYTRFPGTGPSLDLSLPTWVRFPPNECFRQGDRKQGQQGGQEEKGTHLLRVRGWWMAHPVTFAVPTLSANPPLGKGAHTVGCEATEKPPPRFTGGKMKTQSTGTSLGQDGLEPPLPTLTQQLIKLPDSSLLKCWLEEEKGEEGQSLVTFGSGVHTHVRYIVSRDPPLPLIRTLQMRKQRLRGDSAPLPLPPSSSASGSPIPSHLRCRLFPKPPRPPQLFSLLKDPGFLSGLARYLTMHGCHPKSQLRCQGQGATLLHLVHLRRVPRP